MTGPSCAASFEDFQVISSLVGDTGVEVFSVSEAQDRVLQRLSLQVTLSGRYVEVPAG